MAAVPAGRRRLGRPAGDRALLDAGARRLPHRPGAAPRSARVPRCAAASARGGRDVRARAPGPREALRAPRATPGHVLAYFDARRADAVDRRRSRHDRAGRGASTSARAPAGARTLAGTNGSGTALAERRADRGLRLGALRRGVAAVDAAPRRRSSRRARTSSSAVVADHRALGQRPSRRGSSRRRRSRPPCEERLRARQEVRDELVRHAMRAARSSGEAVVAVDARGRVLQANDAARRRLSFEDGELPRAVRERLAVALRGARRRATRSSSWSGPAPGTSGAGVACATVLPRAARGGRHPARSRRRRPRARRGARQRLTARYGFEAILGRSERLRAALDLARDRGAERPAGRPARRVGHGQGAVRPRHPRRRAPAPARRSSR